MRDSAGPDPIPGWLDVDFASLRQVPDFQANGKGIPLATMLRMLGSKDVDGRLGSRATGQIDKGIQISGLDMRLSEIPPARRISILWLSKGV